MRNLSFDVPMEVNPIHSFTVEFALRVYASAAELANYCISGDCALRSVREGKGGDGVRKYDEAEVKKFKK